MGNTKLANPAPLGLMGFGMTTILLNLANSGLFAFDVAILAMGIFYGGIAQIFAGLLEYKKGNTFGLTAFTSYGSFWLTLVAILLMPKLGEADRQRRLYGLPFALVAGGSVGFYDGFFGPGAGSFYALAFVTLAGVNLAKSTAHAKLLNATSNVGGLLLFIIGGKVIWATGFVMMAGQFIGARAGSRLVLSKGQSLIRPMIVIVSAVMSAKLLYDSHGAEILQWLGIH